MGRGSLAGICHDEELHKIIVDRLRSWLNNEDILTANTLTNHHLRLTIIETADQSLAKINLNVFADFLGKFGVCITRHQTKIPRVNRLFTH